MRQLFKLKNHRSLIAIFVFSLALLVTSNFNFTFAYTCSDLNYGNSETYSVAHLICPVIQVINFLLFSSGAVLIGMILLGAYKYATSVGDVKGIDGAKQTLTYAVIGFIIVVGTYTFLNVVASTFGISSDYASGEGVFTSAQCSICKFMTENCIVTEVPNGCSGCGASVSCP